MKYTHFLASEDLLERIDIRAKELEINRSKLIRIVLNLETLEKRLTKEFVKAYKL